MAQKPYNYDFCQIPNTAEGKEFIRLLKLFRNKDKFPRVDVKGQKLKDGLSAENYPWGYPVKDSQTLRVYMRESEPKHSGMAYFNGYKRGYKNGKEDAYKNIRQLATDELNCST